jgi:hypothetical protein
MKFNLISLGLSAAGIILALKINYDIAEAYEIADGKTQALFGIALLLKYGYKYYYAVIGFVALAFAVWALNRNEDRKLSIVAIAMSLVCIFSFLLDVWKFL